MKTLAERLKYAMEILPSKKIKGVDLARAVGVKPPSVSDWLSGKSKTMEGENLLKASKYLGVSANWLATGSGSPTDKNKHKNEEELTKILLKELNLNKIPVFDYMQTSSKDGGLFDKSIPKSYLYTDYFGIKPEEIFSVVVEGNSMEPEFKEGDMLIVDGNLLPKPGCYVIAKIDINEVTLKKYRVLSQDKNGKDVFELIPLNKDFPPLSSIENDIRVVGVVVKNMRNFKI